MSEEIGEVESTEMVEATDIASPAEEGSVPETIEVSPEEARSQNYVPYDRFREVIEQRNQAQTALDDRQRMLDYYASMPQKPAYQPQSAAHIDDQEIDFEDPLEIARQAKAEAEKLRAEIYASRQAQEIRTNVNAVVNELGFINKSKASEQIQMEMGRMLQKNGRLPDVREVARSIRQQEVEYEKQIISRYKNQKTGSAARAASTPPPSAPVLEKQPDKESGWGSASKRVLERMRGR